jgi:hypothetical protein
MSPIAVSDRLDYPTGEPDHHSRYAGLDVRRSLAHLGDRARQAVPGADAAAVILLRHGAPVFQSSCGFARAVDRIQYRIGQGPCVDAARQRCTVVSGSLGNGESRWPQFVTATRELEVASALSLPLMADNEVIGSVNLYSRQLDAFGDDAVYSGGLFAQPAAALLSAAASLIEPDEPLATACGLPPELVHGIEAVLVTPTIARVRSAAITSVIEEIYQTLAWVQGGQTGQADQTGQAELCSLAKVLAAACAHEARMAALDGEDEDR